MKEYALTLLVTAAVTYLLTPLVRRLAIKVRAVPQAEKGTIGTSRPAPEQYA